MGENDDKKLPKDRRGNFVRLAETRTNKALEAIEKIGNISNKGNYEYTDVDISKIKKALTSEINEMSKRFENSSAESKPSFRLGDDQ